MIVADIGGIQRVPGKGRVPGPLGVSEISPTDWWPEKMRVLSSHSLCSEPPGPTLGIAARTGSHEHWRDT